MAGGFVAGGGVSKGLTVATRSAAELAVSGALKTARTLAPTAGAMADGYMSGMGLRLSVVPEGFGAAGNSLSRGKLGAVELSFDKTTRTWTSPAGLDYGPGSVHGNRIKHVLEHATENPSKPIHSVFNAQRNQVLGLVDEAWVARTGPGTLQVTGNRVWVVDLGRQVGTVGQTAIQVVVRDGTTRLITAFPK